MVHAKNMVKCLKWIITVCYNSITGQFCCQILKKIFFTEVFQVRNKFLL